jgi:hypothetical protein
MPCIKKLRSFKTQKLTIKFTLTIMLSILIFSSYALSQENHPCKRASLNLRGDWNVVGNRGGLWSLMEQTEGLQDKSVLGMQIDGKFARLVGQFETMCEGEKKPSKKLFASITNLLGKARAAWNPSSSGEALIKLLKDLNNKLDTILSSIK